MTKDESTQLMQDVAFIKQGLVGGDYGPGLIKDHTDTKARTYENQRAIAKFKTVVYTIGGAVAFLGTVLTVITKFKTAISAMWSPESLLGPMLAIFKDLVSI